MPCSGNRALEGSHHAQAMQAATPATVLGDFADAKLNHFGVVTTFSRAGDKFMVRTDGPDGALHDYEIAYTFGVYPLQQYLIAMPGGRLQALGIAWDSRPKEQGGQRWLHLYPDQRLPAGDRLHWTGRDQTWNYMCADCHSTDVKKKYDLTTNTYATTWTDVDVSCEACHGPGSRHVAWAQTHATGGSNAPGLSDADREGLTNWLKATDHGHWEMNPETGIARRTEPLVSAELDACAACHSRRRVIAKDAQPGAPLLDSYAPAPTWSRACTTPTARSTARCSNTAPSCRAACITRASHARIAMSRTAWICAPRVTRSAANAICRRNSTRPSITITNPAVPARSASTAICRRRPTWWWIAGGITAFAFRGRICRRRSARRTRAPSVTPTGQRTGRCRPSLDGIRMAGRPRRTTAPR